jgi:beta-glucanase (GH16 family)
MNRFLLAATIMICLNCSEDDVAKGPENLQVVIDVATDGSGNVAVTASADNSNYYKFFFGESSAAPVQSEDGHASHQYLASGSYVITVQAHSSEDKFISELTTIDISVDVSIPESGYTTPETYDGLTLVWQDEFAGTVLNPDDWSFETGTGSNGWGNNELEYYQTDNTILQDGHLVITAKRESKSGSLYTSSRLITKHKQSFRYGRVDVRAALPEGQGIWPAVWMLGENIDDVGWPRCGEIDIMEMIGGQGRENTIYGTAHWDNNGTYASYGGNAALSTGTFADEFHVFSIVWTETSITWYLDDVQYHVIDITPAELSEFQNDFFFIFNVAVGGNWPGSPDGETIFPQHMIVDYIRLFQQ